MFKKIKDVITRNKFWATVLVVPTFLVACTQLKDRYLFTKPKLGISCEKMLVATSNMYKNDRLPEDAFYSYNLKLQEKFENQDHESIIRYKDIVGLYVVQLQFKNIGKKNLTNKDFYKGEPLGIRINDSLIGVSVLDDTPQYINPKIEFNKNNFNIIFDVIKPNDSIYLSLLYNGEYDQILTVEDLYGKGDYIDRFYPLNLKTIKNINFPNLSLFELSKLVINDLITFIKSEYLIVFFLFSVIAVIFLFVSIYRFNNAGLEGQNNEDAK